MNERWVIVPKYPGYKVSSLGRMRSYLNRCPARGYPLNMKPYEDNRGYRRVILTDTYGVRKLFSIHRLMILSFYPHLNVDIIVRHLDGNPSNNRLTNLAPGTTKDNCADRDRHGRTARGEKNAYSKLTAAIVRRIRNDYVNGAYQVDLAKKYGLWQSHISRLLRGESWKHTLSQSEKNNLQSLLRRQRRRLHSQLK